MGRQLLAASLVLLGFTGIIVICALPMWKVSAFVGSNILTARVFWEGLWMNCVLLSTGNMQCKVYNTILALSQNLQVSRALICISLAAGGVGIVLMVIGARATNFYRDNQYAKIRCGLSAGVVYIIAGVLCLIAVSWSAQGIIVGFYSPTATDAMRGELGASIYAGWLAGFLLILGGSIFLSTYSSSC
ncbi:claudin-like protein ZF-A89 [Electrophorus electricus]|uniref:claudin-like protein ZF-A89 n=1 Tax=Electrophorus electricus TaxID=8005 RepID=UPI0015D06C76|nr:claudin-like protein ZF-A89 [Electrophorus electricus]